MNDNDKKDRCCSYINRAKCKKFLLEFARSKRAHKFTRVSGETLNSIEADLIARLRSHVDQFPSKGRTL